MTQTPGSTSPERCVTSPAAGYRCVRYVTTGRAAVTTQAPSFDRPIDRAKDETWPIILFGIGAVLILAALLAFYRRRRSLHSR